MCEGLTLEILNDRKKSILCNEAKAFIRVRSNVSYVRGRLTYQDVPDRKDEVIQKVVLIAHNPVNTRFFQLPPQMPLIPEENRTGMMLDVDDVEELDEGEAENI